MTLALVFATPLLLIGLLAAAIPFVLHLLSSVKAQEVLFPTLRFLKSSMQRTSRRRKLQHWLLLLLRAALLGLLALAVAEPLSKAGQGWLGGEKFSAVVILDNSYSMQAHSESSTRFALAKSEAMNLLGGDAKNQIAMAAVLVTNGPQGTPALTADIERLRPEVEKATISYGRAPIAQRVQQAVALLQDPSLPQRSIYIFSDLQRSTFEELLQLDSLAAAKDIHLFIIDTAHGPVNNVGISNLEITGKRVVDQSLEFTATLINSSPVDKKVQVALRLGGQEVANSRATVALAPAGHQGSSTTVKFYRAMGKPGVVTGDVVIPDVDDLPEDNVRSFSLEIADRVKALIVRGPPVGESAEILDGAKEVHLALNPFTDASSPWSIRPEIIEANQFTAASLKGAVIAFFCEMPNFTADQAKAISDFTAAGGTSVLFLGPQSLPENYNKLLLDDLAKSGGLLPARIEPATGEVGPGADAFSVEWMDTNSDYLKGIFENKNDFPRVLVQRYYKLSRPQDDAKVLMRLKNTDPLVLVKPFGKGKSVLFATTASPRWANLPVGGGPLFLPMLEKLCLSAARQSQTPAMYSPDSQVTIPIGPPAGEVASHPATLPLTVWAPGEAQKVAPVQMQAAWSDTDGFRAIFAKTAMPGLYRWQAAQGDQVKLKSDGPLPAAPATAAAGGFEGAFAVNPVGSESDLDALTPKNLQTALNRRGLPYAYVAPTLKEAGDQAETVAQGHNWWDLLLAIVIVLLVAEAMVANRKTSQADAVPAHLNPKLAKN
jgi:hypothetical protein